MLAIHKTRERSFGTLPRLQQPLPKTPNTTVLALNEQTKNDQFQTQLQTD